MYTACSRWGEEGLLYGPKTNPGTAAADWEKPDVAALAHEETGQHEAAHSDREAEDRTKLSMPIVRLGEGEVAEPR